MTIPPFITNLFSDGLAKIGDSVKSIIDESKFSEEEKAEIQAKMNEAIRVHITEMTKIAATETEMYLKDVDSARQLQIEALKNQDLFSKRFIYYLTTGVILLTFAFDFSLLYTNYPERNHDLINMVVGILNSACLASIINFFYGSTKGSEKKTEAMEKMANNR